MPNLQTIPKKGRLAKPFRQCLVASPGCLLVEADFGSAEAVIIGWLSGDSLLARLSRIGFHKYLMAKKMGRVVDLNNPDEELAKQFDALKEEDQDLYNVVKPVVYGSFYLAGAKTLFEKNPDEFESQRQVKQLQDFMFSELPAIKIWQQKVVGQKYRWNEQTRWGWIGNRLVNPFGYSAEYWDLAGTDGPAACAFLPQSTIGSLMKEALLQLWGTEARKWLSLQVHDSLVADVPIQEVPIIRGLMETIMGQAWPQLNGLRIGVEVKVSESL